MTTPSFIGIAAINWNLTATPGTPAILWHILPGGEQRLVGHWETQFGEITVTPRPADYPPGLYLAEERHPNPNLAAKGDTHYRGYVIAGPYSVWAMTEDAIDICRTIVEGVQ